MSNTVASARGSAPQSTTTQPWPFRLTSERSRSSGFRSIRAHAGAGSSRPEPATERSAAADRLREAGLTLLAERPFHQTGMRDITKASGLSLSQIYALAGSKEGLVSFCLNPALDKALERLAEASRQEVGARRRLAACLIELSRLAFEDDRIGRILHLHTPRSLWSDAGQLADGHGARRSALFEEIMRHGVRERSVREDCSPQALTRMALAAADGVIADHVVRDAARSNGLKPDWGARGAELAAMVWPMVSAD